MSSGGRSFHKKDWLTLGAGLALGATGLGAAGVGPMAGLFGASGAGAAGAGVGAVGAGEALAGGGIAGMGAPMASMFGPSTAGAGLLGTFAQGAGGMTPLLSEIALGATAPTSLAALGTSATAFQPGLLSGMTFEKGLKGLEQAQKYMKLAQGQKPQMAPPAGRPPGMGGGGGGGGELAALQSLFSNPVGKAQLEKFLRARGLA